MSPAKSTVTINGHRPSPLKINEKSHSTHKSSSSLLDAPLKQKQRQPIIIYTASPKVIHTQARDFMALVQRLTGCNSGSNDLDDNKTTMQLKGDGSSIKEKVTNIKIVEKDDSSSGITDENCGRIVGNHVADVNTSSSSVSPIENPFFGDIPLFTPNSINFFLSPATVYRFADSAFASPNNMGNSPSVFEFIKGLPEC